MNEKYMIMVHIYQRLISYVLSLIEQIQKLQGFIEIIQHDFFTYILIDTSSFCSFSIPFPLT